MQRRDFFKVLGLGTTSAALSSGCSYLPTWAGGADKKRPNILWITCEDIGPNLGCYGDPYAVTPNIDRLAREGLLYRNAFTTAPVGPPARSCLIAGVYATTLGTQHVRSDIAIPAAIKALPEHLRAAGYYCSNNAHEDYNVAGRAIWDDASATAHWRGRRPGQPFFSVFTFRTTHQGRINGSEEHFFAECTSRLPLNSRHDPAKAPVPPFYPATPIVRQTLSRCYDLISLMDEEVGSLLAQLEADGLAADTIVFFFAANGLGLPRCKRWLYDTGLRVPLILRFPPNYRDLAPAGGSGAVEDLVSFIQFAPTALALAGVPLPAYLQGKPFLGKDAGPPPAFVFGAVDRVDEAYELSRSVRDKRYKYIRNYLPQLPYAQGSAYADQAAIMNELRRLAAEGKLAGSPAGFMSLSKPIEELYDLAADPWELADLADVPDQRQVLDRMRRAHAEWMAATRDIGFLPEAEMHSRAEGSTPYDLGRRPDAYPQERIVEAARLVYQGPDVLPEMSELLRDRDGAVRYWAAIGLGALGLEAAPAADPLVAALLDPQPSVRFAAAGALCALERVRAALPVLAKGLEDKRPWVVLAAARTLQQIGAAAAPVRAAMEKARNETEAGVYESSIRWALEGGLRTCGT